MGDNFFKTSILSVIQEDRLKFPVAFLRHLTDYKVSADIYSQEVETTVCDLLLPLTRDQISITTFQILKISNTAKDFTKKKKKKVKKLQSSSKNEHFHEGKGYTY